VVLRDWEAVGFPWLCVGTGPAEEQSGHHACAPGRGRSRYWRSRFV